MEICAKYSRGDKLGDRQVVTPMDHNVRLTTGEGQYRGESLREEKRPQVT